MKTELRETFKEKTNNLWKIQWKLPKLTIIKLESVNLDQLRFWSQFETEIDHTDITDVSKF